MDREGDCGFGNSLSIGLRYGVLSVEVSKSIPAFSYTFGSSHVHEGNQLIERQSDARSCRCTVGKCLVYSVLR
jgi:hypothetical protein